MPGGSWTTPRRLVAMEDILEKGLCGRGTGSRLPERRPSRAASQAGGLVTGDQVRNCETQALRSLQERRASSELKKAQLTLANNWVRNAHHCSSHYLNKKKAITEAEPRIHQECVGHYCGRCSLVPASNGSAPTALQADKQGSGRVA